jgi:hypothetical protein
MIVMSRSGERLGAKEWTRGIEHTCGHYNPTPCSKKLTLEHNSWDTHSPRPNLLEVFKTCIYTEAVMESPKPMEMYFHRSKMEAHIHIICPVCTIRSEYH